MSVCTMSACLCLMIHDVPPQRRLRYRVKWRFPKVDCVRSRFQSVSCKRQADMDAANKRDKPSKAKQGCVLSHANA